MVVSGTLGVVLCLPLAGIMFVRQMSAAMGYSQAVMAAAVGVLAATFVLGWMLRRILLRPMTELKERAAGVRAGADDALDPLEHYGTADMQALGQSVLEMGRALRGREAVLRSYADHVTHELKSPITVVRGAAELLATPDLPIAEREKLLARVEAAADRMSALLDAQRALARAQEPAAPGRTLLSDAAGGAQVLADGDVPLPQETLELVLEHLVGNARAHGAERVTATIAGGVLVIEDDGPGVSDGNRARIFEPFFTTRRAQGGTGMGLSIVQRLLEAHGAEITLAQGHGTGARFEIRF